MELFRTEWAMNMYPFTLVLFIVVMSVGFRLENILGAPIARPAWMKLLVMRVNSALLLGMMGWYVVD
jgi:hypothetical protein